MNRCLSQCLRSALIPLSLALISSLAVAQGSKMTSPYDPIKDEDADRPIQRELWFARGRTVPGENAAALRYRAHQQKMQMRAHQRSIARSQAASSRKPLSGAGSGSWVPLGPAPLASDASGSGIQDYNWVSGRSTSVAIDPADSTGNTVFVGGAYGGVWKSTNAGPLSPSPASVTWTSVTDDQPTLATGAIAIQPGNNNPANSVVLVGTGEANSSADSYYGIGILRSTNGGSTWTTITQSADAPARPFAGMAVSKIAFSTANTNLAVAAFAGSALGDITGYENPITVNRGLYYSQDGGASWHYATVTDSGVAVAPGSATSVTYNATAGMFFAALRFHGIYSSSDGIHWSRLAVQPGTGLTVGKCPANPSSQSCPIYRGEFTVTPGRNETYLWFVDASDNDQGIWRSTNAGGAWTQLGETGITSCGDPGNGGCGTQQGTYNLELQAVANGSATDLYAGAINIYKCTLATTSSTTCTQSGGGWLNLTHVYGCSSIAKVHPDQHDLDAIVSNGKSILYFSNDGGVYRALDGFTGLTTTTCGQTNQFDSLNQTLGSMTQFVSFSQHPTDPNTLLGGTQDNGSPATASSQTSSQWLNVNAGDGGFNAINPANTTEWFTANTDVTIQRCTSGISCLAQTFPYIVQSANVGGDHGEFYTPYILDPQSATSELIVGTCRVWRGPGVGGNETALSNDFEPGGIPPCSGTETNLVRALVAGGPKDSNGFSNVIYAGTDSFGPGLLPAGGHVWVTTNAAGGTSTWADRTGSINPSTYPIPALAMDASDGTGNTAYVGIMGFHVSHVWKTTNAGVSWTDFTGTGATALPDAPVNAVLVDSASGVLYAATDVGVFSTSTSSPSWTEVGPAPNSGLAGFLPNVAVTALRLFSSGGSKKLRASTYGRGIWEFNLITTPDFQISVPTSTLTIFPTQNATYSGTFTALNGYNSQVALSCTGTTVPSLCLPSPTQLTPTPTGLSFAVTASDVIGDYSFNVHGVGSDTNTTTHDFPLLLHVVDFGISSFSTTTLNANEPNSSQPITFQVTGSGSFNGFVSLGCSGLPNGATCNFSPGVTVTPTSSAPVTVTLTIGTTTATPVGTSAVVLTASTAGAPDKTQNLTLNVTANPDYTLVLTPASASAVAGSNGTLQGVVTAYNGYTNSVNLSCVSGPPTCTLSATNITPATGSGTPFTVTVGSSAVQNYSFSIAGVGTDPSAIAHSAAATLNSTFDFSLSSASSSATVKAGTAATYMLTVTPAGSGNTFPSNVTFSCSGNPLLTSCGFAPAVNAGSGATAVTLTISTTAPALASHSRARNLFYGMLLPLPGLVFAFAGMRRRTLARRWTKFFLLAISTILLGSLVACGGGGGSSGGGGTGQPGTPVGTYTVMVTATSGSAMQTTSVTLTVQ